MTLAFLVMNELAVFIEGNEYFPLIVPVEATEKAVVRIDRGRRLFRVIPQDFFQLGR